MKKILIVLLTVLATACFAQSIITVNLSVTNGTTNGMSLTVNGDTRTFTNSVVTPGNQMLTNTTAQGSANNLYTNLINNSFAGPVILSWNQSTNLTLTGAIGEAMIVTISGNWASNTTSTQSGWTNMMDVRVPLTGEVPLEQTNIATLLENGLNSFSQSAIQIGKRTTNLVVTNFPGSNNWTGDLAFTGNSLALGNSNCLNVPSVGVYERITGPTATFYISGIVGGRDGQQLLLENNTSQIWWVSNNAASETTATNKIQTGINAPIEMTNIPSFVHLTYDGQAALWDVDNHSN